MAVTRWSVDVEQGPAQRIESQMGDRALRCFVARAVEHEPERDLPDEYLDDLDDDLDAEFGAVPAELIDHDDEQWPTRSSTARR